MKNAIKEINRRLQSTGIEFVMNQYIFDLFNKKYDAGHWNDLGAFYGTNNIQHIYVPAESVDEYKTAVGWSTRASVIQPIPS